MRKLALILALCLLFAGCTASENPETAPEAPASQVETNDAENESEEQSQQPQGLDINGDLIGSVSLD